MNRPDEDNIRTLLDFIKDIKYGRATIEIIIHDGWIAGWDERPSETKHGHKAPLKRGVEDDI